MRVDANGNDEGKNTHVSVFGYLMKGKNDDNLPWPFTGEVTITLLNQLTDENHNTYISTRQCLKQEGARWCVGTHRIRMAHIHFTQST